MLGRLSTKAVNSSLGYKSSKAKTCAMESLYKSEQLYHNRLKVLENAAAVLVNAAFKDLQEQKTRIDGHDVDLIDKICSTL